MKKQNRLALRKITLADVSPNQLTQVAGGMRDQVRYTKQSVCAEQSCESDRNAQCRTL